MHNPITTIETAKSTSERQHDRRPVQVMVFPGVPTLIIDTMQFPLIFAPGDVKDFNQQFIDILEDLRRDVQGKGIDLRDYAHDYLEHLRDLGKAAYNKVLPSAARERIADLESQTGPRGLSLTFKTPPSLPLFWEMLYAGEPFGVDKDQFWGFRYPLGRTFWNIEAPDCIRLQRGIFSAVHDRLKFSREEVAEIAQRLQVTGEILGLRLSLELLEHLITPETLSVEHLLELFHSAEFDFGIIHFACHAENIEEGATQAYLSFTAHQNRLDMCLSKLLTWQDYGFVNRPFVFINACSSATPGHLLQTLSFPTEMLNFGAGGVIATACTVPDNFASAFASELYKRLFENDEDTSHQRVSILKSDIGEALLATRLHFLHEFNNPLGLAYGLYAVSNQKLSLLE
jgi:hypothetical protein